MLTVISVKAVAPATIEATLSDGRTLIGGCDDHRLCRL